MRLQEKAPAEVSRHHFTCWYPAPEDSVNICELVLSMGTGIKISAFFSLLYFPIVSRVYIHHSCEKKYRFAAIKTLGLWIAAFRLDADYGRLKGGYCRR